MDVNPPNNQISSPFPVLCHRPVKILRSPIPLTVPVSPDDIVECVEIKTENSPSSENRHVIKYGPGDRLRTDKGAIIDIWF